MYNETGGLVNQTVIRIINTFNMNYLLLTMGALLGMLVARVGIVCARGGLVPKNPLITLFLLASNIGMISIFVWGFMNVEWWVPILVFLTGSFIVAIVVTRNSSGYLFKIKIIPALATLGVAYFLWFHR